MGHGPVGQKGYAWIEPGPWHDSTGQLSVLTWLQGMFAVGRVLIVDSNSTGGIIIIIGVIVC